MESEQSDDPDEAPAPLPEPPAPDLASAEPPARDLASADEPPAPEPSAPKPEWQQRRVDPPKRSALEIVAITIGVCAAVVLGISGLAGLAIVILFNVGFSHWGSNK